MLVDVALPVPLFRTFSYHVPAELRSRVEVGTRVLVPFRNKREIGIVFGSAEPREGVKYKDILAAPDDAPSIDPPMLALCRWIADYYVVPLGVALRCALPAALTGAAAPVPSRKTQRVLQIGHELPSLLRRARIFARAPQQRAVYELLEALGGRVTIEHLHEQLPFSSSVLRGLVARGLAEIVEETVSRDPFLTRERRAPDAHEPTPSAHVHPA